MYKERRDSNDDIDKHWIIVVYLKLLTENKDGDDDGDEEDTDNDNDNDALMPIQFLLHHADHNLHTSKRHWFRSKSQGKRKMKH